ncbi:alpha/beta hydrolase [Rapidithrix thailandica]|uniref:Alpha/beta hydrolase n=1 Tax=Rapidithrix thailandica TaxID=413964 RepID=A0AAW9RVZ6_9BACT
MKKYSLLSIFVLLFTYPLLGQSPLPEAVKGSWVGTLPLKPYPDLFRMDLDSLIQLKLYYKQIQFDAPKKFYLTEDSIYLTLDHHGFKGKLYGQIWGDHIQGKIQTESQGEIPLNMIKIEPQGLESLANLLGYFEFEPGHIVQIAPFMVDFDLTPISILDYKTGKQRIAFPRNEKSYVAGKKMLGIYPPEIEVTVVEEPRSEFFTISLADANQPPVNGRRLADLLNQEDILVHNQTIELHGTITYPNTTGPYPLVIFVPGAGMQYRGNMLDDYIRILPYMGIATLVYDKRGCGFSSGSLTGSSIQDLANDLTAFIEHAAQNKNIDPQHIGLVGLDQAGYVMPVSASQTDKIAFMVSLSGPTVSMMEQELTACAQRMAADGYTTQDIRAAQAYTQTLFRYLEGEVDSTEMVKASKKLHSEPWKQFVTSFDNKEYVEWWRKNYAFSPETYLNEIDIPILAIYGEQDILLSAEENSQKMRTHIDRSDISTSRIVLLPEANHLLMLGETRGDFQFSEITGYSPELFQTIFLWLRKQTGLTSN